MAHSQYTPGLAVTDRTTVVKVRELPLKGRTLVKVGERVGEFTPVLSAELPGELDILRIADRMGLNPEDILPGMKVKVGDDIAKGSVVCELKTFFGFFTSSVKSPVSGCVEFFTEANAHLGIRHPSIPLTVNAYIKGKVIDLEEGKSVTVETDAALIQGIFGVGGERHGEIMLLDVPTDTIIDEHLLSQIESKIKGKILIGGASFTQGALKIAANAKVAAIVTGSVNAETLKAFVGFEIGVSITGDEDVPFTLIITEGFGHLAISERVLELAKKLKGLPASVNGATQVRAGAMRPEIIVSLTDGVSQQSRATELGRFLDIGSRVRIIRVPYFGRLATVVDLPHEPMKIPSGAKVRVLKVSLESGETATIPRANVELI